MSRSFDVKSGLIGGLLALLILSALGGAPWMERDCHGRFAMMGHPGHAYVFDTLTGQVWSMRVYDSQSTATERTGDNELRFYDPKVYVASDPNSLIY